MAVYPAYFYRDPLEKLLQEERSMCRGCIHKATIRLVNETRTFCTKGKRYGSRCKSYDDGSDR